MVKLLEIFQKSGVDPKNFVLTHEGFVPIKEVEEDCPIDSHHQQQGGWMPMGEGRYRTAKYTGSGGNKKPA